VTVVNDLTTSEPRVLYVAAGRSGAALDGYFDPVGAAGWTEIQMVAMDMWPAYIGTVREHTEALIGFDKFTWRSIWRRRSTRYGERRTDSRGNKATTDW